MLNVFQSNRLEVLVTILTKQLTDNGSASVLTPETVLVQSPGMAQWLKLEIAKSVGIAANFNFPLPSSFIWQVYQHLLPDIPQQSPYNKDRLSWVLFQILPQFIEQQEFEALRQYLDDALSANQRGGHSQSHLYQLRQFQLAEKIADVFDNYLMYRPHWLKHWQLGHRDLPDETLEQHQWQSILWRAVVQYVEQQYVANANKTDTAQNKIPALHRADMQGELLALLSEAKLRDELNVGTADLNFDNKDKIKALKKTFGERISIFGISTIAEQQIEVFEALAQHIDVDIYWFNPCSLYWGDVISPKLKSTLSNQQLDVLKANTDDVAQYYVVGNPLLASWGKVGKDYLDLIARRDLNTYDLFIDPMVNDEAKPIWALHRIQQDILNLEFRQSQMPLSPLELKSDKGKRIWQENDESIQIHLCHSRLRELEVLKDTLLGLLAKHDDLLASDILVMMPDVNTYSPFIDTVFAGNYQDPQFIPYTVADKQNKDLSPSLVAFIDLILLPDSRFTITELLDLIEVPFMVNKFGFEQDDLNLIRNWVSRSQIKWGISGSHKSKWDLPSRDLNTWSNGLKQMLLGVAVDEASVWQDIVPLTQVDGMQAKSLGKLLTFFTFLLRVERVMTKSRTPREWQQVLNELLTDCFESDTLSELEQNVLSEIRDANMQLADLNQELNLTREVSYKLVHRHFTQALNQDGVTQRFLAGKLNFCSLMPMRSVPFKVVCVLGLNDSEFPRNVDPISFDLVSHFKPKKGDRNRKWDERYLLLEALCSARQVFYTSYLGYSARTNDELPPSVLLSEFKDYLQQSFLPPNDNMPLTACFEYHHKLQPYDSAYFADESGNLPRSFNRKWFDVAQGIYVTTKSQRRHQPLWQSQDDLTQWLKDAKFNSREMDFAQVVEFWQNPIRGFYRQQLDVRFEMYTDHLSDVENFKHDGLTKYKTNSLFLERLITDGETQLQLGANQWLLDGQFPSALWGEKLLKDYIEGNQAYVGILKKAVGIDSDAAFAIERQLVCYDAKQRRPDGDRGQSQISYQVAIVNNINLAYRSGRLRVVDMLACWLSHLLLNASGRQCASMSFGTDGKTPRLIGFPPLTQNYSAQLLQPWLTLFNLVEHDKVRLQWHPETAYAWLSIKLKGGTANALSAVLLNAINSDHSDNFIAKDDYARKYFNQLEDFDGEFMVLTELLMSPMMELGLETTMSKISALHKHIGQVYEPANSEVEQ